MKLTQNNTAELSGIVEALSLLWPAGPVSRGAQAGIFYDSKKAVSISEVQKACQL